MSKSETSKPLHRSVFERLSRDIMTGRYRPGQKFPSEAALVKRFNVSRITVTRAVRELQQQGFVDRVAGSGTYVRQSTRRDRGDLLFGLIIPDLGETEIFEPICQGIAASPDSRGHGLLWCHSDTKTLTKEEQALEICQQCISREVSGVFFAPLEMNERSGEINNRILKLLKAAAIPVVLLDRRPEDNAGVRGRGRCDLVGIDNHRAGYIATEHLLRRDARNIGFIGYENQASTVRSRIAGYKHALSEAGRVKTGSRVYLVKPGERLVLPPGARDCDAFVCANDRIAGRLMHTLRARRIRIPGDVRLVGIDDVSYAELLPVPLTTVHQPCRDIGETALRVMLERLDRPQMAARDVLLDCELVVRESCGGEA